MSSTTLRPTSTVTNGSSSIGGGAGSRHAALSDDSDTTYVDLTGNFLAGTSTVFGFSDPGLDPDAIVLSAVARVKAKVASGTSTVGLGASIDLEGDFNASGINLPTASSITTAAVGVYGS